MKIASTQPTFLPYPGYFGLIDHVDYFVLMDNVSFASRSWQQRVLIRNKNIPTFITVPVIKKKLSGQFIINVDIDLSRNYIHKHLESIRHSYSKFPYFENYYSQIERVYLNNYKKLIDLNLAFIKLILFFLKINDKKLVYLSNLNISRIYQKDELILQICKSFKNVEQYTSTIGAENYLKNNKELNMNYNIKYFSFDYDKDEFFLYKNKNYHLSIIDLLFKYGDKSLDIIRSRFTVI